MRTRSCPNRSGCWDYETNNCENCAVGKLIKRLRKINRHSDKRIIRLVAENDSLRKKIASLTVENEQLREPDSLKNAVVLKAKKGDKIYFPWIWDGDSDVGRMTIIDIRIDSEGEPIYLTDLEDEIIGYWAKYKCGKYQNSDFGEIVFAEKDYDKAKAKLKELRGEK